MRRPLYRKPATNSVRLPTAAPSRDWNVFKQICAEHWDGFPRPSALPDGLLQ